MQKFVLKNDQLKTLHALIGNINTAFADLAAYSSNCADEDQLVNILSGYYPFNENLQDTAKQVTHWKDSIESEINLLINKQTKTEMKKVKIMGLTKGELIKIAYDNNAEKLRNVDPAIPADYQKENPNVFTYWLVTDYNDKSIFGQVRNLKDVAAENGIQLVS